MRILVTGATGQLGTRILERLSSRDHEVIGWSRTASARRGLFDVTPVDLTNFDRLEQELAAVDPDVILHTAAMSSAESVRNDPDRAHLVNVTATERLVDWASRAQNKRVIYTSTDLVFDGSRAWNRENTVPNPLLAYGRSKLAAEACVLSLDGGLAARLSLLFGFAHAEKSGFFDRSIESLRQGRPQEYFMDEYRTPLDYHSAAEILVQLAESSVSGLVHVGGTERMTRFDLMRRAAAALGIDQTLVRPNRRSDVCLPEPRPADVSLDTTHLRNLLPNFAFPSVEQALLR